MRAVGRPSSVGRSADVGLFDYTRKTVRLRDKVRFILTSSMILRLTRGTHADLVLLRSNERPLLGAATRFRAYLHPAILLSSSRRLPTITHLRLQEATVSLVSFPCLPAIMLVR